MKYFKELFDGLFANSVKTNAQIMVDGIEVFDKVYKLAIAIKTQEFISPFSSEENKKKDILEKKPISLKLKYIAYLDTDQSYKNYDYMMNNFSIFTQGISLKLYDFLQDDISYKTCIPKDLKHHNFKFFHDNMQNFSMCYGAGTDFLQIKQRILNIQDSKFIDEYYMFLHKYPEEIFFDMKKRIIMFVESSNMFKVLYVFCEKLQENKFKITIFCK